VGEKSPRVLRRAGSLLSAPVDGEKDQARQLKGLKGFDPEEKRGINVGRKDPHQHKKGKNGDPLACSRGSDRSGHVEKKLEGSRKKKKGGRRRGTPRTSPFDGDGDDCHDEACARDGTGQSARNWTDFKKERKKGPEGTS